MVHTLHVGVIVVKGMWPQFMVPLVLRAVRQLTPASHPIQTAGDAGQRGVSYLCPGLETAQRWNSHRVLDLPVSMDGCRPADLHFSGAQVLKYWSLYTKPCSSSSQKWESRVPIVFILPPQGYEWDLLWATWSSGLQEGHYQPLPSPKRSQILSSLGRPYVSGPVACILRRNL